MIRKFRHILSLILIITGTLSLSAETISRKEASRIAEKFFNAAAGEVLAKPKYVYNGRNLTTDRLFSPFYVFNHPKKGFVIISADNKAMPVLAYSLTTDFDVNDISALQQKLLREYALDIEYIRYDGRIPLEAIDAWIDMPVTIDHAINSYHLDDDFVRLENDGDVWIARKKATEFPGFGELSEEKQHDIFAEPPFAFYDNFVAETRAEEENRQRMFEEKLHPVTPTLRWIGGGHFEAVIPDGVQMVRIYNMDGSMVRQLTFRHTDTAVFNIDSEPTGFYVVRINDLNGKSYGFKIYK